MSIWLHLATRDHLQMVIVAASGHSGPFANDHCGCIWPLGTICKWSLWLHPATRDHLQMVIVTASGHSGLFANGPCCLFCPGPFANGLFRCLSPPGTICKWSLLLSFVTWDHLQMVSFVVSRHLGPFANGLAVCKVSQSAKSRNLQSLTRMQI